MQPVCRQPQECSLGANAFEEHHELKPEEDDRINGRAANACDVAVPHEVAHKGQIEHLVQVSGLQG